MLIQVQDQYLWLAWDLVKIMYMIWVSNMAHVVCNKEPSFMTGLCKMHMDHCSGMLPGHLVVQ